MNRQQLEINGQHYWFKIGMRGIIYLQTFTEYTEEDIFAAGLITLQDISITKAKSLYDDALLDLSMYVSFPFFSIDIQSLYIKAVGEMRFSLESFLQMTPDEIESAYEGYLTDKESTINLILLAINKALTDDITPITLIEIPEYRLGNEQERAFMLNKLGCL